MLMSTVLGQCASENLTWPKDDPFHFGTVTADGSDPSKSIKGAHKADYLDLSVMTGNERKDGYPGTVFDLKKRTRKVTGKDES